jgi:uroporphyrinogen III methyltransferase/synthase
MTGTVYLVGAGPGDPGLITVKGLELVRRADVLIYDRLIPRELLEEAKTDAEKIDVGKLPQQHRLPQDDINRMLIEKARQDKVVVRLKGGDPFVFGRGGEEALACYAAGVPFVLVPGVTSAIAVPAYAGIPVTHRHTTAAFTVFAGHEDPTRSVPAIDYAALAAAARLGTLVLLMGVTHLAQIAAELMASGIEGSKPAACIEWGTTAEQRVVEGTLATIAQQARDADVQPPAVTVIGDVATLRNQGIDWYKPQS